MSVRYYEAWQLRKTIEEAIERTWCDGGDLISPLKIRAFDPGTGSMVGVWHVSFLRNGVAVVDGPAGPFEVHGNKIHLQFSRGKAWGAPSFEREKEVLRR